MNLKSRSGVVLLLSQLVVLLVSACTPSGGQIRKVQNPFPTATASATPQNPGIQSPRASAPQTAGSCAEGSEPARPDLRACCKERNWGQACDGNCWAEGVGEKLERMCNAQKAPASASDCGSSPAKDKTKEWCNFHYNRRYCGISDADWVRACTPSR